MPGGFQGSVVVTAVGLVAGVSNNVNYDVQFDGSAAYNMPVAATTLLNFSLLEEREEEDGEADGRLFVSLPVPFSVPVLLEITNEGPPGPPPGNASFAATDQNVIAGSTNASGLIQRDIHWLSGASVTFDVNVYYDVNNNGILDVGVDVLMATGTFTIS